jgi:hypothetical protein
LASQNIRIDVSSLRGTDSHLTAYITGGRGARLILGFAKKLEEVQPAVWMSPNARGIRHVVGQLREADMPEVIKRLIDGTFELDVVDQEEDDCYLRGARASEPSQSSE